MHCTHGICCYRETDPLFHLIVTQVSWMNNLDACMRLKCKTPMKEGWPFPIGSCLDKKQVNLACEGARPSSQLSRHSWQPLVRGKKKKGWIDVDWTWMALSSVLDSMPDRKEPASILEKNTVVVVSSLSKVNLWYFCVLSHLLWSWIFAGFSGSLHFSCTLQKWHSGATFLNNRPYLDDTSHKILNSIFCAAATKKNKRFSGLTRNIRFGCQRCNNI